MVAFVSLEEVHCQALFPQRARCFRRSGGYFSRAKRTNTYTKGRKREE